jgi:hypothetical protein
MHLYIMPEPVFGRPEFPLKWPEINWLQELPENTFYFLWANQPSTNLVRKIELPLGHPMYVITFHQERFDWEWIIAQSKRITDVPIIILNDGSVYDLPLPPNVRFYNYYSWHEHIDRVRNWWPDPQPKNIRYKVSNVCNRVTQSKLLIFTALMQYLKRDELLVKLANWVQDKNVHGWMATGVRELDDLMAIFQEKYLGVEILLDDFCNVKDNYQRWNSNPWQPLYLESALHFVSESYHYSLMHIDGQSFTVPGPQYSEKLYKCLLAGTPFIMVGQFESHKYLSDLGLRFDYGDLDLSWDLDPGNLTRMVGIVNLIKTLRDYSMEDLVEMTNDSTKHNTDLIWSGEFYRTCQEHNRKIQHEILTEFGR